MKCVNAETLLPLYARADLDRNSHSAVAAHLESCAHCRQLADEYKNIQSWIRLYEPPEFSEEFFADIRQNVLREVSQRPVTSSTFSIWLKKVLAPTLHKPMFAAATAALLIVACVIGLLVFRGYRGPAELTAKDETVKSEPRNGAVENAQPVTVPAEDKSQALQEAKNRSRIAFNVNNVNRVRRSITRMTPVATTLPTQDTVAPATELTSTGSGGTRSVASGLSDGQAPLRVEMQTQNPNIRIIWFAPNPKQSSVTN